MTPGAAANVLRSHAGVPVPPDRPTPGAGATDPLEDLRDRVEALTLRVVGMEAATQGLQQGAQSALNALLTQAQGEFEAQRNSLLALRADVQQEAGELRGFLGEAPGPRAALRGSLR